MLAASGLQTTLPPWLAFGPHWLLLAVEIGLLCALVASSPRPARAPLGGPARWWPRAARVAERVTPLTRWAKAMMMLQSAVSVAAIVLVVARAVNILG